MITATDRRSRTHTLGAYNPEKETILEFMRSGDEYAIAEGYVEDYVTGDDVRTIVDWVRARWTAVVRHGHLQLRAL